MSPAKEPPAWYHRVRALEEELKEVGKTPDFEEVFDEDLSDLSSLGASEDYMYYEDCLSERSYDGPDADSYYRLKSLREERKRDLIEAKEEQAEFKKRALDKEDILVKKIQTAIEAVQKAESRGDAPAPFNSVANTEFHLYCVDYVRHCFWEDAGRKRVDFSYYVPDKDYGLKAKQPPNSNTKIGGQIYFTDAQSIEFEMWYPPKEAGSKKYSITSYEGKYEFTFQFVSNDYLIATVPRDFVFQDTAVDPLAPETFTMYGVRYDFSWVKKNNLRLAPYLNQYEWKIL